MLRAKVLIVEEDPAVAMTTREVLTLVGFEVAGVAATASDALCLAENIHPNLAIVGVRLAGRRDGVETATLLRERLGLPVVFVTTDKHDLGARATELKPLACLEKPIHPRELIEILNQHFRRPQRTEFASRG